MIAFMHQRWVPSLQTQEIRIMHQNKAICDHKGINEKIIASAQSMALGHHKEKEDGLLHIDSRKQGFKFIKLK